MTKMSDTPQDRCIGLPLPVGEAVPQCGTFAAHYPHPIGESIRYRRLTGEQPLTPAEDRTGVSDVQASIADEVAALRAIIKRWCRTGDTEFGETSAHLDRITALVPQRATDADKFSKFSKGDALWLHDCGGVMPGYGESKPDECSRYWCNGGDWRALYTVAGR